MVVTLLGSTGLVGGYCLRLLLEDSRITRILLPVRKIHAQTNEDSRLCYTAIDFGRLAEYAELFQSEALICCLGTTIKKAGSRQAFEEADVRLPLAAAALARRQGARICALVSAMGAHRASPIFYNRCKGLLEEGMALLGFESLTIARPSLLLGQRREHRPGEALMQRITLPLLPLIPAFWRPVHAETVAERLVRSVVDAKPGLHVLYNRQLM